MIDGLTVAKKKLTYEGELVYLRTAPECVLRILEFYFHETMKMITGYELSFENISK